MRRSVPWLGAVFIAAIVATTACDIVRSYRGTVEQTGQELDTQARIIAEQTARSLQAVDVVLRHLEEQHRQGALEAMTPPELHAYLREQSVGLVQIDGLLVIDADGTPRAASMSPTLPQPVPNVSNYRVFQEARAGVRTGLAVDTAVLGIDGQWVFPIGRRLETPRGEFAGVVAARGRVEYFQQFYRDIHLEPGTRTTLMHRNGTLIARYPPAPGSIGKRFAPFDEFLAAYDAGRREPMRSMSPIDGIERFGAIQAVPDYPLAVIVTRDTSLALAGWRREALGSAIRTLALAALAAVLLALVVRQLSRLDSSEERFALAVAGSKDGIVDWDIAHDRMFTSKRAMEIIGIDSDVTMRTRAEWVALLPLHPDDVERHTCEMLQHLKGETAVREGEYRMRHPDGVYRWVRVRGTSVRDATGRAIRWAGSVSDIDTQKRTEQALRQSDERYQLAVAGSNEGLWDWDMRDDMLFLSARAQMLLGMEPGEPLRPRRDWLAMRVYHPDDEWRVRKALSAHLRGRTPHFVHEYRMRHASGEWRWYRQRGVAVRDERGRPYRVAGSMEDVTERHRAEAQRERLETQLRQAQKLEAIGTLAGGIAHDFNNILAAILGYGEMAQREAADGSAQRRHIDAAMSAAQRAKSLVERILAFSRSGVGDRVPVHVQSVVEEAMQVVAASMPSGVRLERYLAAGDAAVMGDATQIHQVVTNLCSNAVQAMRAAGVLTVRLDTVAQQEPHVATTSTLAPGRYIRLVVADTGVGIAPKVLERIFDPFFTTREIGVGTGLGLSLVHGIVTDLGGGIDVQSEVGKGTMLTVLVPWQCTTAALHVDAAAAPAGDGETVLLVDDEEDLVRLGEEMMAELGYEPVGFASSTAALASFRTTPQRFSIVVSDESMPELTGSELAREIRRLRPDIPIVLVSGYVTPGLSARAKEIGVVDVLAKPLVLGDIARSLANALHRQPHAPSP